MAKKERESRPEDDEDVVTFDNVPSALDDKTHNEIELLYRESTETLRFVKNLQWKTVGATLIVYFGLVVIAALIDADRALTSKFMGITILLAVSVIFTLAIYQFWMHNEMVKIDYLGRYLSGLFRRIRALKSKREGDLHRYTLLVFMIVTVTLGAIVVHLALDRIATH